MKFKKRLVILVLAIVFLAVIVVEAYFFMQNRMKSTVVVQTNTQETWTTGDEITWSNAMNPSIAPVTVTHGEDRVITFADAGMEALVRAWTGKSEGDLMRSDVWDIRYLFLGLSNGTVKTNVVLEQPSDGEMFQVTGEWSNAERIEMDDDAPAIESLEDLRYFESLQILVLSNGTVTDISPLTECKNLTTLRLIDDEKLYSLAPVSEMTQLTYLAISYTPNFDLSIVSSLENLKILDIGSSKLATLEPLSGLPLEVLCLDCGMSSKDNIQVDFSPLATLTELRYVGLYYVDSFTVDDAQYLTGLSNLRLVDVRETKASKQLDELEKLLPNVFFVA